MNRRSSVISLLLLGVLSNAAWAQLDRLPVIQGFAPKKSAAVTHTLVADVQTVAAGVPFRVGIRFDVKEGSYLYYKTPGSLGLPTRIDFQLPEGFTVGPLQFPSPEIKHEQLDKPVIYYVYPRSTVISAEVTPPKDLPAGSTVDVRASINYQFCDESNCTPVTDRDLSLVLATGPEPIPSEEAKQIQRAVRQVPRADSAEVVQVEPFVNVDAIRPNDQIKLALDLSIKPGYHIQMHQPPDATLISTEVLLDVPDGVDFSPPVFPEPLAPRHPLQGLAEVKEYRDRLTVVVPIRARKFLQSGELVLQGYIRYQACDDNGCQPPAYAPFSLVVPVVAEGDAVHPINEAMFATADAEPPLAEPGPTLADPFEADPLVAKKMPSPESATATGPTPVSLGALGDRQLVREDDLGNNLALYLVYAFLGGLILNVMPCVLPVIAIKVLGFVNQAGEDRGKILLLNLAYSAGVIGVFMLLASMAAFAGLGWGQLFQSSEFNLAMASIVFAMGLSLLGVFEIPVPGFAGTIDTTQKEGPLGAFLTGVLATLLATPCSGPFMGVTLTWSVRQPPYVIFAVWGVMGLGMAFPYILCGIFPGAVKLLPKPGMWMVRFKEMAGFVLLATVVYIVSFLNSIYVLPLLVILLGITISLWMVSNLYDHRSSPRQRFGIRLASVVVTAFALVSAYGYFKPMAEARARADFERMIAETGGRIELPSGATTADIAWIPFTEENLTRYVNEGRTVFIDFTADWCLICKANEVSAIETQKIKSLIDEYGVVPLKADWTDRSDEIKEWLHKFDGASVPHYVLIPGASSERVIVFDGALTESKVAEKIREAGPSKGLPRGAASSQISLAR